MSKTTPRHSRRTVGGGTLLLSGLAFSAALAAQPVAPLPARLAEALHGQSASARVPQGFTPARLASGKAPGSIAPSPQGAPSNIFFTANFDDCGGNPPVTPGTTPPQPFPAPPQFTVHNVDNRTPAASVAYVNKAWIVREDFQNNSADCVMFATSWYSPAGQANDWAAFPTEAAGKITPTAATQLRWNAKNYDPLYLDGYEVRYSTAGTAVADFMAHPALYTNNAEAAAWTARTLSLSSLAGTPIHLAFRLTSTDKFLLVVDDIVVENLINFDPALTALTIAQAPDDAGSYGAVPAWLGVPYDFSATVRNNGLQTLTDVVVDADVLVDGDAEDMLVTPPIATLAPATSATTAELTGLLDQIGRWTIEATVSATQGDQVPENSSLEAYLVHVTQDEITRAVPDEAQQGSLGVGAGNGGELGNDFVIDAAAKIVAIRYTFENADDEPVGPPVGDGVGDFNDITLQATLRAWDPVANEPGAVLHTLEVTVPEDAPIGPTTLEFPLPAGTVLAPGRYLVAAVEPTTPPITLTLHTVAGRFVPGTSWVDWPTSPNPGWSNVEDFGAMFAHPFRISAVLVPPVTVPTAADDAFELDEDAVLNGDVSDNDALSDDGGNVWSALTQPEDGNLVLNADGSFSYTPDAGFNGSDSFIYELCDADDDCSTATVSLTVDAVDDAPLAADDAFTLDEDTVLEGDVSTNDTLSDDGGNVWTTVMNPDDGTFVFNADGTFSFTPEADFNGGNVFTYSLCDVDNNCSTATVTLTVNAVDDAPLAADDSFTVAEDEVLEDTVAGNDTPSPDGDNVWSVSLAPASGTLVMADDGSFSYTPAGAGTVTFEYTVCVDGRTTDCATATATIEVTDVTPLPPEIFADSFESE